MINKPIDQIEKADIEALIADERIEAKTLEYKEELPKGTDEAKKEFLADVSSFANASGGDIVYGIKEKVDENGKKTGKPEKIVGIQGVTIDEVKLRLESMIRDNIAPRLKVQLRAIEGFENNSFVLVIRIPQSFAAPHMVTYKKSSRFFSRNSAGKYPLDVDEIRSAFIASEALPERIRNFRADRLSKIIACETPVLLKEGPKIITHLVPIFSFFKPSGKAPIAFTRDIANIVEQRAIRPYYRHNFDGYLGFDSMTGKNEKYLQIFRNGVLEFTDVLVMPPNDDKKLIPSVAYEAELIHYVDKFLHLMKALEIEMPILIMVSLIGVKGFTLTHPLRFSALAPIDRDNLVIPEVMIEDYNVKSQKLLKPIFDSVWQASGYAGSMNYDDKDEWNPETWRRA